MKSILLLSACAALSGCVAYGGSYGASYGGSYGYSTGVYAEPAYVYGPVYGQPGYVYDGRGQRDRDGDGIANRYDRDRDGDGVRNRQDSRPNNPRRN